MLSLSRSTGYAVLALAHLEPRGNLVKAQEIARVTKIPTPFLHSILRTLAKAGLVLRKGGREVVSP